MKEKDNFLNVEALTYDNTLDNPEILIIDSTPEELLYLSNIGYSVVGEKGKFVLHGTVDQQAKIIVDEINEKLTSDEELHDLADYVRLKMWSEETFVNEVKLAIAEVTIQKAYEVRFFDVLEYIVENWKLTANEIEQLKKEDADYYQELSERSYQ